MGKTRKISKNQNRGNGCTAPWSDLNHHLLYLVLMKLQVFDFVAFSGVCKSWRSLGLSNKTEFMASRPPMAISISTCSNKNEYWLRDSEGGKSKLPLPLSDGRKCIGLTCGYFVLFGRRTSDIWLVNPVTRHGLHFPKKHGLHIPKNPRYLDLLGVRAILVFSHSVSAWVFVFLCRYTNQIWYSIAGTREWNYVSCPHPILDLNEFKGKIYAIDTYSCLYELGLDPEPKLTLLETKSHVDSMRRYMLPGALEFVCSGEKLYAIKCFPGNSCELCVLDFGEMKWVSPEEKTMEGHALFRSSLEHSALVKQELLADSWSHHKKYAYTVTSGNCMVFTAVIWYFAHDCLKVNLKYE